MMERETLQHRLHVLTDLLKKEMTSEGYWKGKLSSSALSTATAVVALGIHGDTSDEQHILSGYNWLCANINADGGYGDTPLSESNVSTSLLCYAAIYYCRTDYKRRESILRSVENFLGTKGITLNSLNVTSSILKFYGNDYTFSVPILSMLTLCGVLDDDAFRNIPQLPFEMSLLPASWYRFFNLQVVSYAIPALIGVGIYLHNHNKAKLSLTGFLRNRAVIPALKKLTEIMPESGGFLEAIPLTAFVNMCLVSGNQKENEVVKKGIDFLRIQQRSDGSWPIDTDLSTWVTTLAVKSLGPQLRSCMGSESVDKIRAHLLKIQYKEIHPFNKAKPGGWGWTNYSGSVPDADDTPGAILALLEMYDYSHEETDAIINGLLWLEKLQNSDGGFPTFCKGWGRLPFDRSCADLSSHSLLAFSSAMGKLGDRIPASLQNRFNRCVKKAANYLEKHQSVEGFWNPLWFGNQKSPDKKNPVYGTAKVCIYLDDCLLNSRLQTDIRDKLVKMIIAGRQYLLANQNSDGSWGGKKGIPGTVEETALAISALAKYNRLECLKGFEWLDIEYLKNNLKAAPVGLYFAALWYDEKMYPLVYYIEALRKFCDGNEPT